MKSILVVGSAALDTIETPWGSARDALGGSAIYFAAAARHFAPVRVVGVVGGDFPLQQLDFLKESSVSLEGLKVIEDGKSFRWHGRYHEDPNNRDTLLTELNVFEDFNPVIPRAYSKSELLFLANIDPYLQLKVLSQVENPDLIILDTMNFWIEHKLEALKEVISKVDILIVNDEEVRQLTGESSVVVGADKLFNMGPRGIIIKKGEHGALMLTEEGYFFAPAFPLEKVWDPTGAGDTFAGGFVGYLAMSGTYDQKSLRRAMVYGSTVASFTVEDFSITRLAEVEMSGIRERFAAFRRMTEFE